MNNFSSYFHLEILNIIMLTCSHKLSVNGVDTLYIMIRPIYTHIVICDTQSLTLALIECSIGTFLNS